MRNSKKRSVNFFIFIIFTVLLFISGCREPFDDNNDDNDDDVRETIANFAPSSGDTWTFMIYLDADNNLEEYAIDDFQEMINGMAYAKNGNINLIVQMDRIFGNSSSTAIGGTDWEDTRRYQITSSGYTRLDTAPNLGELNMGDPQTLKDFINYCKTDYSADHYALILWNHGDGCRSSNPAILEKAICSDDTNSDILYIDQVQDAINDYFNSGDKLDLIGFDACLMATVEVAYEFRELANYMAGSMGTEGVDGWEYNLIFGDMISGKSPNAIELSKLIVNAYRDSTILRTDQMQSALDLSKLSGLKTKIDQLGVAIADYVDNTNDFETSTRDVSVHFYNTDTESVSIPYYDLYSLCSEIINDYDATLDIVAQEVIDELANVVVRAYAGSSHGNYYGDGSDVKRGLSIFFSRGNWTHLSKSHYTYQWWYTAEDTNSWEPGYYYGLIDFCDSTADETVESWRELMEYWYDNPDGATPSSW